MFEEKVVKKGRGKMRYTGDELFEKKNAENGSNCATNGSSSTSSSRYVQCVKEISQFTKDNEDQESKQNPKQSSSSQKELSKNYNNLIKNILTGNQDKSLGKKSSDEKAKSQDLIEETKEKLDLATTSQRSIGII